MPKLGWKDFAVTLALMVFLIVRSKRLMAERRATMAFKDTRLLAFGILVAVIGVAMLTAAAYLALAEWLDPQLAALIVSLVDFALAEVFVMTASKQCTKDELKPFMEVSDIAVDDVSYVLNWLGKKPVLSSTAFVRLARIL